MAQSLVLEDVGEAPYRIDRMLTHWRTAGLLQNLAGIGLGHFRWIPEDVLPGDLTLEEVLGGSLWVISASRSFKDCPLVMDDQTKPSRWAGGLV